MIARQIAIYLENHHIWYFLAKNYTIRTDEKFLILDCCRT
jgi:uncharacterized protein YneR